MRLYRRFNGILQEHLGGSIAIGNFDGVHLGHQEVIQAAGKIAKKHGNPWGVLTFEPHPRSYFNKDMAALIADSACLDSLNVTGQVFL